MLKLNQSSCFAGLFSHTFPVTVAGPYTLTVRSTFNSTSSMIITLSQSGSRSVTIANLAPGPNQTHSEQGYEFQCQIGDVLTAAVSSAAPSDVVSTAIKSVVTLVQGN